ncbi:MAG TPA: IPT/TIG domain-containing protein [Kofleriaceae bacterium]|nr:IPT/TIG domain-containing protein [Kofleriaceae bacterium]
MSSIALAFVIAACGNVKPSGTPDAPGSGSADAAPDAPSSNPPSLTSVSPMSGIVSSSVTITGARFGATQGSGTITIGGKPAAVTSWADTQIVAGVPDVLPASVDVVVTTSGGASAPLQFRVILPPRAYLNNDANDANGQDTITVMSFDPSTGAMAQLGTPIEIGVAASSYGGCSQSIVVHEGTRHLFATGSNGVASYTIDPVTGALTAAAGSPFAVGSRAFGLIPNAAGTRLFVTSYDAKTVSVFDVAADAKLTPVTGSPFTSLTGVDTIATAATDGFVYANSYEASFQGFKVGAGGALTSLGAAFTPGGTAIAQRTAHEQLYVTLQTGAVGVWNVDTGTGTPTQITGSPFTVAAASTLVDAPVFTGDGNRAYFGINGTGKVLAYTLAADGTPTAITGSPFDFSTTVSMSCLALSRDGAYLLGASEGANAVGVFKLDGNGVPTQVAGSPFTHTTPTTGTSGLALSF